MKKIIVLGILICSNLIAHVSPFAYLKWFFKQYGATDRLDTLKYQILLEGAYAYDEHDEEQLEAIIDYLAEQGTLRDYPSIKDHTIMKKIVKRESDPFFKRQDQGILLKDLAAFKKIAARSEKELNALSSARMGRFASALFAVLYSPTQAYTQSLVAAAQQLEQTSKTTAFKLMRNMLDILVGFKEIDPKIQAFLNEYFSVVAASKQSLSRLLLSPNNKYIAWAGENVVSIFDAITFKKIAELVSDKGSKDSIQFFDVNAMAFHPLQDVILVSYVSYNGVRKDKQGNQVKGVGKLELWDIATAKVIKVLENDDDVVNDIAFNHAGTVLASVGNNPTDSASNRYGVQLWQTVSWKKSRIIETSSKNIHVSFNSDDTLLEVTSLNGVVNIVDIKNGKLDQSMTKFASFDDKSDAQRAWQFLAVAQFSPIKPYLLASMDNQKKPLTIGLLDIQKKKRESTLRLDFALSADATVGFYMFSNNGLQLLAQDSESTVYVWQTLAGGFPDRTLPLFVMGLDLRSVALLVGGTVLSVYPFFKQAPFDGEHVLIRWKKMLNYQAPLSSFIAHMFNFSATYKNN